MKMLIAIMSCHRDRVLHDTIRSSWLKDVDVPYKFFIGDPFAQSLTGLPNTDEIFLPVPDDYQQLSAKTQGICNYGIENGYDFLYKCDTDTVVSAKNLGNVLLGDYVGGNNEDYIPSSLQSMVKSFDNSVEFASGGAGYILSHQSMEIVATELYRPSPAEDVFVALSLKKKGITPQFNEEFKWRPGARLTKETISYHLTSILQRKNSPHLIVEYYDKMKNLEAV